MKSIKFSLIFSCLFFQSFFTAYAQDYFSDEIPEELVQFNPSYDASSLDYAINWTIENRSILSEEGRLEDIIKHHTIGVNPVSATSDFCWLYSKGRGVGTIPNQCKGGKELENGLCYTKCTREGYGGGGGPLCLAKCPRGFTDTGLHCLKPKAMSRKGFAKWSSCEKVHGKGNCERWGLYKYRKCPSGYKKFGCCVCTPICPSNTKDIGVSCQKKSYGRGVGTIPTACSNGKVNNGGLCYNECGNGTKGVGPVCWQNGCPSDFPVKCGLGCAKSHDACKENYKKQFSSSADVILTIAVVGIVTKGYMKAGKVASKKKIKSDLKEEAIERGNSVTGDILDPFVDLIYDAQLTGDFDWEILGEMEPTGIYNLVKAFNQPICGASSDGTVLGSPNFDWKVVASENQQIPLSQKQDVIYGAGDRFYMKKLPVGATCSNSTFGGDPIQGVVKQCFIASNICKWKDVGGENQKINISKEQEIFYGANGKYIKKTVSSGAVCSNQTFGADPNPGVAKKCWACRK